MEIETQNTIQGVEKNTNTKVTILKCLSIGACLLALATFLVVTICGLSKTFHTDSSGNILYSGAGFWNGKIDTSGEGTPKFVLSGGAIASIVLIIVACTMWAIAHYLAKGQALFGSWSKVISLTTIIAITLSTLICILCISSKPSLNGGETTAPWGWIFIFNGDDTLSVKYSGGGIFVVILAVLSGLGILVPTALKLIKSKNK